MLSDVSSTRRHRHRVVASLAGLLVVAGCGSAPGTSPPSGVDQLVIPTPSPDPGDFVPGVDNPWFPLVPGGSWTRELTGTGAVPQRPGGGSRESVPAPAEVLVEVLRETRVVAGVETTPVRTTLLDRRGEALETRVELYAQDREGNVWAFGEPGAWQAGTLGAEAGLAMPATPRVGDGFVRARVPGTGEYRVRVQFSPTAVSVPAGHYTDLVQTLETGPDGEGEWEVDYARGVGEVLRAEVGGDGRQELVARRR